MNSEPEQGLESELKLKETDCAASVQTDSEEPTASEDQDDVAAPAETIGRSIGSSAAISIGSLIDDRYEVLAHLGSGGMGEVYRVLDRNTQVVYALKIISAELAQKKTLAKRLEHEAQAARTLVHGNIVTVYDVGKAADGAPYLLMDYIEGESLENILRKETLLPASRALPIFIQIAEALVHARQKSVVHRDLKPSNILLAKTESGSDMVKIVDFGIAKIIDTKSGEKTKLTQTGELLGTPLYMSPEQCVGDDLDERSDIYSLGCIMYEVLTGKAPFAAENSVKIILNHLSDTQPTMPSGPGISSDLREVLKRCLKKNRFERYQSAIDLHIDLERVRDGRKIKPPQRKSMAGNPKLMAIVLSICLVFLGGLSFVANQWIHPARHHAPRAKHSSKPYTYKGKSLAEWTSLIEQTPQDGGLYFGRGCLHEWRQEFTNAIDDFTLAIELNSKDTNAHIQRANTYVAVGKYEKAMQDADRAIALSPHSAKGYETRGFVSAFREDFDHSIADLKTALNIDKSAWAYFILGQDYMYLAKYGDAETSLDQACSLDKRTLYKSVAGLNYCWQQKFAPAWDQFKMVPDATDGTPEDWQLLAYYYLYTGKSPQASHAINLKQWRSAYEDLRKAIQLNQYSGITLSYLAMCESHLGMKAEAQRHIREAFAAKNLPPILYVNRAAIELDLGDAPSALTDTNTAATLDPWLKEAYELRAKVEDALEDQMAAKANRARAAKLKYHFDI